MHSAYKPHERLSYEDKDGMSLTRQEFADECDINNIMARYENSGMLSHLQAPNREPMYVDAWEIPDFRSAMDMMNVANAAFMSLPASVRREFDNDPALFVEFVENRHSDEKATAKLKEWGLLAPEEVVPPPQRVEIVNPPPAPPAGS